MLSEKNGRIVATIDDLPPSNGLYSPYLALVIPMSGIELPVL
jgi:hypothetical protein